MKKSSLIFLVLWAVVAAMTFNPFGAFLGTLSYKAVPADKAVPQKAMDIRLKASATLRGLEEEADGREVKAGTTLNVLGTCHDIADGWSPRACVQGREYLAELPDGIRGRIELPQMEGDSTFLKMEKTLVYLLPSRESASAAIEANEKWLEAHEEGKFFTKAHGFLKKLDRGRLRLLRALSPKVSEGGQYFLFPRLEGWSVYNLPHFFLSSFFRKVWNWICAFLFLLSAHIAARKLAILPYLSSKRTTDNSSSLSGLIYLVLALGITYLAGITQPLPWVFLFAGIGLMRLKSENAENDRCPHCHQMTMQTYRRETIQHNSNLVRTTTRWKKDREHHSSVDYTYQAYRVTYRYDRCTRCGYERPKYKSWEETTTEFLSNVTSDDAAREEFNKTDGKVTVQNF